MDDYLVVLANDGAIYHQNDQHEPTSLLAFDLLDGTVQEVEIEIGSFQVKKDYSLIKYGANQIIKYGGDSAFSLTCITVESFEPLKVRWEAIEDQNRGRFIRHTAQIFQDSLYVYGKVESKKSREGSREELWRFDLKNHMWKLCVAQGEAPELAYSSRSFIYQGHLYLYGVTEESSVSIDLFMLDLESMKWVRIEQREEHLECWDNKSLRLKFGGAVYKDHLVVPKNSLSSLENALCFLNLETKNAWSAFGIQGMKNVEKISRAKPNNLMVYKNLLLSLVAVEKKVIAAVMNLDDFGISASQPSQKEHFNCLFLRKSKPDVAFKVKNRSVLAHKQALVKNSQYFADLFNVSGSRQQHVIKVQDCRENVFQKYLQFIYQGRVQLIDSKLAIRLYTLADRYLQRDLCEECVNFLSKNIGQKNAYKILDFAHEKNILILKNCCMSFFQSNLDTKNVTKMIKYLGRQEDSEFKENNRELRNFAFRFVLEHLFTIYEKDKRNAHIYEDFLLKNIEMDTLPALAHFMSFCNKMPEGIRHLIEDEDSSDEDDLRGGAPKRKSLFEEKILQLREAAFCFAHVNAQAILTNGIPDDALKDFILSSLFMSQVESDIALRIEDQIIPAHKQFLMQKSHYFKNVFDSGMIESRQDIIKIEDCEYDIFKEYLRFTYQGIANLENTEQAIKVYALADKYLQEDLCKECVDFLSRSIKEDNVYTILDFAHEKSLPTLKTWCMRFFKKNLDLKNVVRLIEYLGRQEDSEYKENNRDLRNYAFSFVLSRFFDINEDERQSAQIYEDFLLQNIEMDTLPPLVNFLNCSYKLPEKEISAIEKAQDTSSEDSSDEEPIIAPIYSFGRGPLFSKTVPKTRGLFDERTIKLKEALFRFIQEDVKAILTKEISKGFSIDLLRDFTLNLAEKEENNRRKGKKRMEPGKIDADEENPTLKKTKKV